MTQSSLSYTTRIAAAACIGFTVAGCTKVSFEHTAGLGNKPERIGSGYSIVQNVPRSEAFIKFDELVAGTVGVNERIYSDGIRQRIVYAADAGIVGENHAEVRVISSSSFSDFNENLKPHGTERHQLHAQFKSAFPGRVLSVDPSVHYNEYGTFSFSFFNPKPGYGCMFGWQNAQASATKNKARYVIHAWRDRTTSAHNARLSYRVRYCAKGLRWADAVHMMKTVRYDVPTDVFVRERSLQWQSGTKFAKGLPITDNAEDLNYISAPPYSEGRDGICAPGSEGAVIDNVGGYASSCKPVAKKPVVRTTKPKVTRKVVAKPAARPKVTPRVQSPTVPAQPTPTVPHPNGSPLQRTVPLNPNGPVANANPSVQYLPAIQPNQPATLNGQNPNGQSYNGQFNGVQYNNGSVVSVTNQPGSVPLPSTTAPSIAQPNVPTQRQYRVQGQVQGQGHNTVVPVPAVPNAQGNPQPRIIPITNSQRTSMSPEEEAALRAGAIPLPAECGTEKTPPCGNRTNAQ